MSHIKLLQEASSLKELASLIGYKPSSLAFIIYRLPKERLYTTFEIPKKSGGTRKIDAPTSRLKVLQDHLATLLEKCRQEMEATSNQKYSVSHGYRSGFSIVTNARQHRNRRYVLNIDIENFFPSLNFGRVRGFFIKNEHFALHEKVATIIAQIACHNNSLPQGSPCSPIISDLMARPLDVRLAQLARRNKCTYSRYVDDLTFSSGRKDFSPSIAYLVEGTAASWAAGNSLLREISKLGFSINHKKTRMQYRTSRQVVTGLTVNKKINIQSDHYRITRAMCHSLFTIGTFTTPAPTYKNADTKAEPENQAPPVAKPPTLNQLEGVLSHIQYVKAQELKRTQTLDQTLESKKKFTPRGFSKLHKQFLFFKYFIALQAPLVVCEGKTDSIYLKAAIRRLVAYHPKLVTIEGGKSKSKIQFFSYKNLAHKILQLSGGSDPLKEFIIGYEASLAYYKYKPLQHPVIIFVDNDSGIDGIVKYLSSKHIAVSLTSTAPFYHVAENLFLVKTPEIGASGISDIEDFFDPSLLKEKLGDKSFNKKKEHGSATEYGKAAFAERVILPKEKSIDFSKFGAILDRLIAVVESYISPAK